MTVLSELQARNSPNPPPVHGRLTPGMATLEELRARWQKKDEARSTDEFVAASQAAFQVCAAKLQEEVDGVLRQTNRSSFQKIQAFLERSSSSCTDLRQSSPYTELPVALVHAGCNTADHGLTMRQLLHHLKTNCSPHVAVLRSKECGTVATATRSLVSQLLGPSTRTDPGCLFDFSVLAGWHADRMRSGRVAAGRVAAGASSDAAAGHEQPLLVVLEDAERFPPAVLNDLVYLCSKARSPAGGAPLPLILVFAPVVSSDALLQLLERGTLVLLRAERFVLSGTEASVDSLMGRLLTLPSLPPLSAQAYDALLKSCRARAAPTQGRGGRSPTRRATPAPAPRRATPRPLAPPPRPAPPVRAG